MNDFLILHSTDLIRLNGILKQETIYANKYLDDKYLRLSTDDKQPYVYGNIVFCDSKEKDICFGITIFLSSELVQNQGMIFNIGWKSIPDKDSIIYNPIEKEEELDGKIKKIRKMISKIKNPKILNHEVLFIGKVPIRQYLIGICCQEIKSKKVIEKMIKKYNYQTDVYVNDELPPMATLCEEGNCWDLKI